MLAGNSTAIPLLEIAPRDVLVAYERSGAMKRVEAWKSDPAKCYRVGLLVQGVAAYLRSPNVAVEAKKSNPMRASLGYFLGQAGSEWGMPLVETLQKIGVTPIRPGRE